MISSLARARCPSALSRSPIVRVQIPGSAMDLPRRHRNVEPVEDCEGMIDACAGAVEVVLRPGYSRLHFPGERAHVRVRGSESGCQNIIRLAVSIRNIASLQPGFRHSELGVQSPAPMQDEVRRNPRIADLREALQSLNQIPPIEFGIPGGDSGNGPHPSGMLLCVASHDDLAQTAHPFEIEAERT